MLNILEADQVPLSTVFEGLLCALCQSQGFSCPGGVW